MQKLDFLLNSKGAAKEEADSNAKKTVQSTKTADKPEAGPSTKKTDTGVCFDFDLYSFYCVLSNI